MAKKNVLVINDELFMGMDLDELKVYSGKGKAKKLDLNTTVTTVMSVLLYNSGLIDMFETLVPQVDALDSLSDFISERIDEYNLLFDSAIELDEKVEEAFDRYGIVRIGDEEEDEEDEEPEDEEEPEVTEEELDEILDEEFEDEVFEDEKAIKNKNGKGKKKR